jgi:hypothetical protein
MCFIWHIISKICNVNVRLHLYEVLYKFTVCKHLYHGEYTQAGMHELERHAVPTWRSALCVHTHVHAHTNVLPVTFISSSSIVTAHNTTERPGNYLLPSSGEFTWRQNFTWRRKQVVSETLCGVVCCVNGTSPNRYSDNTHKKPLSKIYTIQSTRKILHTATLWVHPAPFINTPKNRHVLITTVST